MHAYKEFVRRSYIPSVKHRLGGKVAATQLSFGESQVVSENPRMPALVHHVSSCLQDKSPRLSFGLGSSWPPFDSSSSVHYGNALL